MALISRTEQRAPRAIDRRLLAQHLLRALARDHLEGRGSDLDTLTTDLQVRREDVRAVLSLLHLEGYLDVLRMRLTLEGFALGIALSQADLPPLRRASTSKTLAA